MAKRLFLIIIVGLLGIIDNPVFLSATDKVAVTGVSDARATQTMIRSEDLTASTLDGGNGASSKGGELVNGAANISRSRENDASGEAAVSSASHEPDSANMAQPAQAVAVAPANSIAIAGRVLSIVDVDSTALDAGDHVNKYGDKFLYGHNSAEVFGGLVNIGVGNVFTVAYNGSSTNYQVAEVVIYEKASDTSLRSDGVNYRMKAIANGRGKYDMVLMTCYGTSYGNGDASHRLVIYANRV